MKLPEPYTTVGSLLGNIGTFVATGFGLRRGDSLFTAAQMIEYRNAALEEAAKVCEQFIHYGEASGIICVKAIRELKEVQS